MNVPESIVTRDMVGEDLADVLAIEQIAHVSPWARLSFEESLTRGDVCRVINIENEVVAYSVSSSVLDELHILNVTCAPKMQGRGLGHGLLNDLVRHATQNGLTKIFLEVRASNTIAQGLYEKWGFVQTGVRKEYYRPTAHGIPREDALIYLKQL